MSLVQKTLIIVLLTVAALMAVLYEVDRYLLLRSYLELEQVQTRGAMTRTESALDNAIADLTKTANDYAAWDRSYDFMKNPMPSYIEQEFGNDTLQGLKVNFILLSDLSGKIVFLKGYDQLHNAEVNVPEELRTLLTSDDWARRERTEFSAARGIVLLANGPALIAACPILTSQRQGPIRGVLVMVRNLDPDVVASLKEATLSSLLMTPASDPELPPDFKYAGGPLESGQVSTYVRPLSKASVAGYALLKDIHRRPALWVRVEMPRAVYQRGVTSLQYLLVALSIASLVFAFTTMSLLRQIVLAPLTRLSSEVGRIRQQKNLSERIAVEGGDEIAQLGKAINHMLNTLQTSAGLEQINDALRKEVQERMRMQEALQSSNEHFQQLFATIPIPVWLRERSNGRFLEVNDAAVRHYGYSREEFLQMKIADILAPEQSPESGIQHATENHGVPLKQKHRLRGGQIIDVEVNAHLVDLTGLPTLLVAAQDVTERNRMEVELLHGQKLQAVGGLAAGVAHEINTPIQFIGDNVRFLRDAFSDVAALLGKYDALYAGIRSAGVSEVLLAAVQEACQKSDLEFLTREVPLALEQTLDGVNRVATIVQALKSFSHLDKGREKKAADLNSAIQSTIVVARNELKYVADVEMNLAKLPLITCHLGDLNQVFLNLLLNAAHSIGDVVEGTSNKGRICVETHIETASDGDWAVVAISDTGKGIPEEVQGRIFEPFFTTKQVGKGSGQGLALARAIVVDKHGGSLTFETELGKGATFYVRIPVNGTGTTMSAATATAK
ncbi:MAG: CHASE4 domain-containing protein [Candidatus Sulfotelmatobacter sp.]